VGSNRWGVIIKTKRSWFVGPNNGLLWPGANYEDIETVWKLNEQQFDKVAHTFHGRDVFVKAAVLLAIGKAPDEFGCSEKQISDLVKYEFENGQIVHIDAYGNVKFLWEKSVKPGEKLLGIPVVRIFTDVQEGRPLILNGSSKTLELAINLGSAASYYGLKLGDNLCKKNII
jgi:S-adenosylmethionine hydrolase